MSNWELMLGSMIFSAWRAAIFFCTELDRWTGAASWDGGWGWGWGCGGGGWGWWVTAVGGGA